MIMARREPGHLILTKEEMQMFIKSLADPERIAARDRLFAELDALDLTYNDDGSVEFEWEE